ncbi:MAG: class I SAM-dependent methyltransferase [Bacteriovoracia bacterium]
MITRKQAVLLFLKSQSIAIRSLLSGTLLKGGPKHLLGSFIKPINSPTRYPEYLVFLAIIKNIVRSFGEKDLYALDVGSPKMFSLLAVKEFSNLDLVSTDVWPTAIKEATTYVGGLNKKQLKKLRLEVADITEPFLESAIPAQGYFDLVYSMSVIEHITPEVGGDNLALQAITKITRPGSYVLFSVPVDTIARSEYDDRPVYGGQSNNAEQYFFQRVYDSTSVDSLLNNVKTDYALEQSILIKWPADRFAFRKFWEIKNTTIRGLAGPIFPYFSSSFSTHQFIKKLPSKTEMKRGDLLVLLRRK